MRLLGSKILNPDPNYFISDPQHSLNFHSSCSISVTGTYSKIFINLRQSSLDEDFAQLLSVSDPYSLNPDPDPAKNLNPDPDPGGP